MTKKQIFALIVIIISFGGAIVMAFLTWRQLTPRNKFSLTQNAVTQSGSAILPKGNQLDFDSLKNFNSNKTLFPYPVVNPSEVGSTLNNLIK